MNDKTKINELEKRIDALETVIAILMDNLGLSEDILPEELLENHEELETNFPTTEPVMTIVKVDDQTGKEVVAFVLSPQAITREFGPLASQIAGMLEKEFSIKDKSIFVSPLFMEGTNNASLLAFCIPKKCLKQKDQIRQIQGLINCLLSPGEIESFGSVTKPKAGLAP